MMNSWFRRRPAPRWPEHGARALPLHIARAPRHFDPDDPDTIRDRARDALREAFTPSRPQRGGKRLIGRRLQLARILRALQDERSHVVLYAERGRGKTSLSNFLVETLRTGENAVARHACAADSTFDSIMRSLARDLPAPLLAAPAVMDDSLDGCEAALPRGPVQPQHVSALPARIAARSLILVVDEFDRILDQDTRTKFADTIKQVSDRGVPLFLVIVGVSDSLEELLGRHPSIQRNIVGVPLPLLSVTEIEAILDRGAAEAGLVFSDRVRQGIAIVARGVPYVAQLLALRAGQAALDRGAFEVAARDLRAAIAVAVEEADPRIVTLYDQLTARGRDHDVAGALRAMAGGQLDAFGRFVVEAGPGRLQVAGAAMTEALFVRLLDSEVIRAVAGVAPDLFTFTDPLLPHYILLREFLAMEAEDARAAERSPSWAAQ
jgi:Cdc6-like AAA superfamily ATPase